MSPEPGGARAGLLPALRERAVVGTFAGIGHPSSVEMLAWGGFELICVDGEHSPMPSETVQQMVRAAEGCGVPCLVRVGGIGGSDVSQALDVGAAGVVIPRVETADEVRACVSAVRYPPAGKRGAGPGRASRYGRDASYYQRANDEVVLVVQVETVEGVEAIDEILAVEGLDAIFVGPGDLSVSLGCGWDEPEHTAAIERVLGACRDSPVIGGIFCRGADDVARWRAFDARLLLVGSDQNMLGLAANAAAEAARAAAG